ncbi:MAG: ATP-binding cassette domain-containing protein [Endomicrobium sp.]|jgi:ATPase subunit of ABC transporter with duplicated ATPase domains|nr:ATP-binding cassette domain-containing protein [Endomicrobium sp.]
MHKPIFLNHISLFYPNKICFEDFSAQIQNGDRIAVIGNNGCGKSSLLKIIKGDMEPSEGEVQNNSNIVFGYVSQLIYDYENLSGGEKFNRALSAALASRPDVLLLDEPTNHLDLKNRKSLVKMLEFYKGTLIVVSHDEELLRASIGAFWSIDGGAVRTFSGKYDDYKRSVSQQRQELEYEIHSLNKEKKEAHNALMKEQERASKSKKRGEKLIKNKRWLPAVGDLKQSSAEKTSGKNKGNINEKRNSLNERLSSLRLPEIIKPKFSLSAKDAGSKNVLYISGGGAAYKAESESGGAKQTAVLQNINISLSGGRRLAVTGDNGSGKTTLFKAILDAPEIIKTGIWDAPAKEEIGYLDQYYKNLDDDKTVLETVSDLLQNKTIVEIRDFLNDFLFRKNEEVNKKNIFLSGGERARLSLAVIAAKTPKLLLLDEITNNIDLQTKLHAAQVLRQYPGAMLVISHERHFLEEINVADFVELKKI